MKKSKLVSVAEYAALCGIKRQAVYSRINSGTLKFAKSTPVHLIDIEKYPPVKITLGRRPYKSIVAVALSIFMFSCNNINEQGKDIEVLKTTIDSCEYLYSQHFIEHKGNCSNPRHKTTQ